MSERKRMTAAERDVMMNLSVADQIVTNAIRDMPPARMRMIRWMKRDLRMIEVKLSKILCAVMDTMPAEQIRTYSNTLRDCSFTTGVKCYARNSNEGRRKDEYGMYLSFNELEALFKGCRDRCMMCGLDTEGIRRCELRKALDAIPNDAPDSDGTDCPYYRII